MGKPTWGHAQVSMPESIGHGGERIRTDDPLRAKQALFQLSYTPDSLNGGPSWN